MENKDLEKAIKDYKINLYCEEKKSKEVIINPGYYPMILTLLGIDGIILGGFYITKTLIDYLE